MSETPPEDPYQPPVEWEKLERKPLPKFGVILNRWHPLRLKYNLIMLAVGILTALPILSLGPILELGIGALFYGILANVFFTLGVIPEIALAWMTRETDHPNVRRLAFLAGLLFSIALTIFTGFMMYEQSIPLVAP